MNKRLFRKALAAVLTVALILTSNGITPSNVSAADKIRVEGVYTNFQKATMSIGTTKQITTYVEPANATFQKMSFKSSDVKVATVSNTGLVTAIAAGTTVITVGALDGTSQKETVKITVLKDLTITKKSVDSDNEVIVMDKTYGNVTISESVGDAEIYLAGVTIKGIFTLNEGDYTVSMYESTAKEVVIDKTPANGEIVTLAVAEDDTKTPTLFVGEDTKIAEINAKISAMIKQGDGSKIDGLSFVQDSSGKIKLFLDNYTGALSIDASFGDIELVATGCNLADIVVTGGANVGSVQLTNAGKSVIDNLTLKGSAKVDLAIPTTQVQIDSASKGTSFTSKESIGTINNAGTESKITVSGAIDNFNSSGAKAFIEVAAGGTVPMLNLSGEGSILSGKGDVSEVTVTGSDCSVSTPNTLVSVGTKVAGTTLEGKPIAAGSVTATAPIPTTPIVSVPIPEKVVQGGEIIVSNDFENGVNDLIVTMGSGAVTMAIAPGGNGSAKALLVSTRGANYHGVGYNFYSFLNKHITLRIKADIKCTEAGYLQATMKSNIGSGYIKVASVTDAIADTWYTLDGTFELGSTVTEAFLYIETPGTSSYYLDNVEITVASIGDAIPVTGVSLDKETLDLDTGAIGALVASIAPTTADNKNVTWTTANAAVATVTDGVVMGIGAGTTTITVKTADGGLTDTCIVNVSSNVALSLNRKDAILNLAGQIVTITPSIADNITWSTSNADVATVTNGIVTAVGNGNATITATLGSTTKKATCSIKVRTNAILVEDFEDNTYTLTVSSTKTIVNDPFLVYDGRYALKVESEVDWKGVEYVFDNSAGTFSKSYKISSYVKGIGAAAKLRYSTTYSDGTTHYGEISSIEAGTDNYVLFEGTLDVPAGRATTLKLAPQNTKAANFYVDNFMIEEVLASSNAITGVTLNKTALTLAINATEKLTATIAPANYSTSSAITWSSSNSSVASVDSTGLVTAAALGTAIITATTAVNGVSTEAKTASCTVTVTDVIVPVEGEKYFADFNLTTNASFSLIDSTASWDPADTTITKDVYLNGTNFKDVAAASGISDAGLLSKFTTWTGVKEVVKGFEYTITVTDGTSKAPDLNLVAEFIIQNRKTADGYDGSFITVTENLGVADISTPVTITKQILFDSTTWNSGDIEMVKAAIRFSNADSATTLTGTVTVKVLSNDKPVVPVGDRPITSITLNKNTLTLIEDATETLIATVVPDNATTSKTVIWSSSNSAVASVSDSGVVTAAASGSAIIYAKTTVAGVSTTQYEAQCNVTVTEAPASTPGFTPTTNLLVSYNDVAEGTPYSMIGWSGADGSASVIAVSGSAFQALEVKPTNYNNAAKLSITLPTGVTLKDYKQITFKVLMKSGDVAQKTFVVEAGTTLSGGYASGTARTIGSKYREPGISTEFETITIDLNNVPTALQSLSGTIELAVGFNCGANKDSIPTVYILDDITLVPQNPIPTVDFNEVTEGTPYSMIGWSGSDGSASVIAVSGSAIRALEVKPTNYNNAAKFNIILQTGKTLNDYKQITFKVLMKSGDVEKKTFVVEAGMTLSSGFANSETRAIGSKYRDPGVSTEFETITIDLNNVPTALQSLSGTIELAVGFNCAGNKDSIPTVYILDDIAFIPK